MPARIRFLGEDVTALPPHRRSLNGLARSFQITSIFPEFTALDNVALAVQAHAGHSFRFWRRGARAIRRCARRRGAARPGRARRRAPTFQRRHLAHGEKRALEIAMALAARPRLLLLDEPTAGMGPEDPRAWCGFSRGLKGTLTILLIEHDMDAVFALADRITVLVYGRVIATGAPAASATTPRCAHAYLGEDGAPVAGALTGRVSSRARRGFASSRAMSMRSAIPSWAASSPPT